MVPAQEAVKWVGALLGTLALISCNRPDDPPPPAGRVLPPPASAAGGPTLSCTDVGRFPGNASCCEGAYCAGWCFTDGCRCGDVFAGCRWPEVCCDNSCKRAADCN